MVPNAVDTGFHRPAEDGERAATRAELGLPEEASVVVHVGRLVIEKAHDQMLLAARELPQVRWLFVGDGPLRARLAAQAAALGVSERVTFLGTRGDVADILRAGDLFCLPSWFEGMPNTVLEAMASGLAVVGTRVPGTADLVAEGESGWLVPPRDAAALVATLGEALSDGGRLSAYGARARARVVADYGTAAVAEALLALYTDCLAS
jgi:glycosyltransferase involved in cell wall biosynthesis